MSRIVRNIKIGTLKDYEEQFLDEKNFHRIKNVDVYVNTSDDGDDVYIVATERDKQYFLGDKGE